MKIAVILDVSPEAGITLDPAEVEKDVQLYLMDFAQNVGTLEPVDVEGGWYTLAAKARVIT